MKAVLHMSRITSIKKQRGLVLVEIEEEAALRIPASLYRERPLQPDTDLDLEAYEAWLDERAYPHALNRAVEYLAARPRTEHEMETRLRQCGYTDKVIARVMARLAHEGFLNDAQFADLWTQARQERALGKRRIAQELARKGVSREHVDAALSQIDEEEQQRQATELCRRLLERTRGKDERDVRRKVLAALVRRGYDWDTAKRALDRAGEEDADDDWYE